jgi:hypothetical protein
MPGHAAECQTRAKLMHHNNSDATWLRALM